MMEPSYSLDPSFSAAGGASRMKVQSDGDPARRVQLAIRTSGAESLLARRSFQGLHHQFLPFTYALASRKSHPDDVEDILQETWIAVWRRFQDPEPVERFLSLLEAICRNKVADANERRYRRRRGDGNGPGSSQMVSLDEPRDPANPEEGRWVDNLESPQPLPETAVLHRERLDELWKLLDRLPEKWRIAVVYRFFNGMSVADTARTMNSTEDAIKKYVFRAIRRLKEWMHGEQEFWLP